ncbi:MAG: hypothetical protein JO020_17045 [Chloroflexi bacterium]|nr:hypothetical protein [Chloroflexota bacterium]
MQVSAFRRPSLAQTARGRTRGQALVFTAFALVGVLAFVGLVLNMGFFLVQRRHLQNAADAMALAATWRVLDEQTSRVYLDSAVLGQAQSMATQNQVSVPTDAALQAMYVDQTGATVGTVGGGMMPVTSAGVQVSLNGAFHTVLMPFVGLGNIQISATSQARLVPVAPPTSLTTMVPLVIPRASYVASGGNAYDLYSLAAPFLDLTTSAGSGGSTAPLYGNAHTSMQYWSDGSHAVGTLAVGSTVGLAGAGYATDVQTGLQDNVRRQNLPNDPTYNGMGVPPYILLDVPLCNPCGGPTVTIVGFARFYLQQSQISTTHLIGYFLPYVVDPTSTARQSGPLQGNAVVVLTT